MIVYRLLGIVVNVFSVLLAVLTFLLLLPALSNPVFLLPCFVMASIVLYAWCANQFYIRVIARKQAMTKKQKDWLQVNAIVAFIVAITQVTGALILILRPELMEKSLKQYQQQGQAN